MDVTVRGKHVEVSEPVAERARRKLGRLDHYLPLLRDAVVEVDIAQERAKEPDRRYVVHVTVSGNGVHLRAEERAARPEEAIDRASHVLTEQARRYKQRLYERSRSPTRQEVGAEQVGSPSVMEPADHESSLLDKVAKVKRFRMKPMTMEEAVEQMEALSHTFFLFLDADLGQLALLYRRGAGDYGLIIPELS